MKLTIKEIIDATDGKLITGAQEQCISGISTDSRDINNGELFVPLKGEKFDGHDYIEKAFYAGASASLVQQYDTGLLSKAKEKGNVLIQVDGTLQAFHALAAYYISKMDLIVIAVTGSTGKTTTKEMIYSVLSQKYKVLKNKGNYNNHIGVPLTVFQLRPEHEVAIFEMGMSELNEIERLCNIVKPDIGVITNIGLSHIENLGTQENIFKAKLEITGGFDSVENILIANGDDRFLKRLRTQVTPYKKYFIGAGEGCDFKINSINNIGEDVISFRAAIQGQEHDFTLQVPGKHNIYNSLYAIATGHILGVEINKIHKGLQEFMKDPMRLNIFTTDNDIKIINDAYNASPDSMKAAIEVLATVDADRKIAVLGDMLEMGDYAQVGHYNIGEEIKKYNIDFLITVGKTAANIAKGAVESGFCQKNAFICSNNQEAINVLQKLLNKKDVILVKGSRGMKMEEIVKHIQERR